MATYAILSYVLGSVQPLLSGIGEGMQPLVSYCCGAHDAAARKKLLKKGLALMLATCAALCAAIVLLRGQLPYVFGASPQTAQGSVPSLLCEMCIRDSDKARPQNGRIGAFFARAHVGKHACRPHHGQIGRHAGVLDDTVGEDIGQVRRVRREEQRSENGKVLLRPSVNQEAEPAGRVYRCLLYTSRCV